MNGEIQIIEDQARKLARELAPQHLFSIGETYHIVLDYLIERYTTSAEYDEDELERRMFTKYMYQ